MSAKYVISITCLALFSIALLFTARQDSSVQLSQAATANARLKQMETLLRAQSVILEKLVEIKVPLPIPTAPAPPPPQRGSSAAARRSPPDTPISDFINASFPSGGANVRVVSLTDELKAALRRRQSDFLSNMKTRVNVLDNPEATKLLEVSQNDVFIPVAVLRDDETAVLPDDVKRVFVEVGTNKGAELGSGASRETHSDILYLFFEPQAQHFYAAKEAFRIREHMMFVPGAAAAGLASAASFSVAGGDTCSSLLVQNANVKSKYRSGCTQNSRRVQVPVLPLWMFLSVMLRSLEVEFVMTDAQGFDLNVVASMLPPQKLPDAMQGKYPPRLPAHLITECQDTNDKTLHIVQGAFTCGDVFKCLPEYFAEQHYTLHKCFMQHIGIRENNCVFTVASATSPFEAGNYGLSANNFKKEPRDTITSAASSPKCPRG